MNNGIKNLRDKWDQLSLRDKRTAMLGGILVLLLTLYAAVWSPFSERVVVMRSKIAQEKKLLAWMHTADERLTLHHTKAGKVETSVALLGLVQKQIEEAGLGGSLQSLKQGQADTIEMHFAKVNFDGLLTMLVRLSSEQQVKIAQLSATRIDDAGMVNAQIALHVNRAASR
jgi:general secretion pathway protein M